ncbi:MAG: hypothetical protein LBR98_03340 [Syntrophomonadaceae bacterium]|nr:hypothetical protein [Syntrophomonadaceae bacterium]
MIDSLHTGLHPSQNEGESIFLHCLLPRIGPAPAVCRSFGLLQRPLLNQRLQAAYGQSAVNHRLAAFYPFKHGLERLYRMGKPIQAPFIKAGEKPLFEAMAIFRVDAQTQLFLSVHICIE